MTLNTLNFGKHVIGNDQPVFIIAEAGDNHLGCLQTAFEMARQAKLAGADAVKFQHHLPDEEMLRDIPMSDNMHEPLYDFLVKNALSIEQHKQLKQFCDTINIKYMCTPFSYAAATELCEANLLDVIKIGSGEMTDIPSLLKISQLGLPMIVSTGMSTFEEIDRTYQELTDNGVELCLTNCVSEYPPNYNDINLHCIQTMIDRYPKAIIGHSDHTPTLYTAFGAVMLGAKIIEKHVTLNKVIPCPDQSVSLDYSEFAELVNGIRILEAASGREKKVHNQEKQIREWAFRSVVSVKAIKKGEVITEDMVWTKRPGTGIPSKDMNRVIGCVATGDIDSNTLLTWDMLLFNKSRIETKEKECL